MGRYYSDGEYWSPADDEANLMFICLNGRVYQKMIDNYDCWQAYYEGYRHSPEDALRAAGIIKSKFKDVWVQKQGTRWVEVHPFE